MLGLLRSAKVVPGCNDKDEAEVLDENVSARHGDKKGNYHVDHIEENGRGEFVEIFSIEENKVQSSTDQKTQVDTHETPPMTMNVIEPQQQLLLFQITNPNTSELRCSDPETWQLIFIGSSTFTDTQIERDILMKEIVPILREKARPYGIDVVDVDMRWGVKDENTDHHMTWLACSQIIERCRMSSKGVFFVSLQSLK
jgi:desulfoferrodoxin (superoxide reductase-like protein)